MELARLWLALKTRAVADTGSGGLFNATTPLINGFYPGKVPTASTLAFPYVVIGSELKGGPHAFGKDIALGMIDFHLYVSEDDSSGDPYQKMSDLEKRLSGDSTNGSTPSFGFHRHPLTISGGSWTATQLVWEGTTDEPVEDPVLHYVQRYTLYGSK